jgi:hypothetical protein
VATSRGSVEQGTSDLNYAVGGMSKAGVEGDTPGRGERPDGTAEVPERQLDIRDR